MPASAVAGWSGWRRQASDAWLPSVVSRGLGLLDLFAELEGRDGPEPLDGTKSRGRVLGRVVDIPRPGLHPVLARQYTLGQFYRDRHRRGPLAAHAGHLEDPLDLLDERGR